MKPSYKYELWLRFTQQDLPLVTFARKGRNVPLSLYETTPRSAGRLLLTKTQISPNSSSISTSLLVTSRIIVKIVRNAQDNLIPIAGYALTTPLPYYSSVAHLTHKSRVTRVHFLHLITDAAANFALIIARRNRKSKSGEHVGGCTYHLQCFAQ